MMCTKMQAFNKTTEKHTYYKVLNASYCITLNHPNLIVISAIQYANSTDWYTCTYASP